MSKQKYLQTANKHIHAGSESYVVREIHIETRRCYRVHTKVKIKILKTPSADMNSHSLLTGMHIGAAMWNTFVQFLSTHILYIYLNELKTYVYTITCTHIYSSFVHNYQNSEANKTPFSG